MASRRLSTEDIQRLARQQQHIQDSYQPSIMKRDHDKVVKALEVAQKRIAELESQVEHWKRMYQEDTGA